VVRDARRFVSGPVTLGHVSEAYDQLLWGAPDDQVGIETEHLAAALEDARAWVHPRHRTARGIALSARAIVSVTSPGDELKEFCRIAADRGMVFAFERGQGAPLRWAATAQGVTINLPQAFLRSEAGTDFYTELEAAIDLAAKAHLQKRQLLRKFADRATGTFGQSAGWTSDGAGALVFDEFEYAVGLSGLNEAVKLLSREEIRESDAAVRLALRIVSYVYFRLREESTRHGLKLVLDDVAPGESSDRFSRIDAQMYPRARALLADRTRYTPGFRTHGAPTFEALSMESRFHTLVPTASATAERSRISPADLFAVLQKLHAETLASRVAVE
jgi:hypothetical protein